MSKPLLIAEKKTAAFAFAEHLPGPIVDKGSYVETPSMTLTWASGHVLEMCEPDEYRPEWAKWDIQELPIVIQNWKTSVSGDRNKARQFQTIKELVKSASYIINAGDAGREGQLIVDEILFYLKNKTPAKRLWLSDIEKSSFLAGLQSMKDNQDYYSTYEAGLARQRADALFGWNATRLLTLLWQKKGHKGVKSAGRVQTPTLGIVVRRDLEIQNFKPENYWTLEGDFEVDGQLFPAGWVFKGLEDAKALKDGEEPLDEEEDDDTTNTNGVVIPSWLKKPNRIIVEEQAQKIAKESIQAKTGICSLFESKSGIEKAPAMPSLNELQGYMNKKFKVTSKDTLAIAQSLYEKELTSYPRTDSRYLPTSLIPKIPLIMEQLQQFNDPRIQALAAKADPNRVGPCFNDKEVTDHYALMPTTKTANRAELNENELRAYEYICNHFLSQFFPDCEVLKVKVQLDVVDHRYVTTGRTVLKSGWREVLGGDSNEKANEMPLIKQGQEVAVKDVKVRASITKPPPHLTEASLLSAMANVSRLVTDKEEKRKLKLLKGIGRSATRDGIIETILARKYMERKGNFLISTENGREFIKASPTEMSEPGLTARWEEMIDLVEKNRISLSDFEKRLNMWVAQTLELIKKSPIPEAPKEEIKAVKACPTCGTGQMIVKTIRNGPKAGNTFLGCNKYPECNHMESNPNSKESKSGTSKPKSSSGSKPKSSSSSSGGETCPKCKKGKMQDRTIKAGEHQGKKFKGCSNYPECKHSIWPK